jgi:hypothetical protein
MLKYLVPILGVALVCSSAASAQQTKKPAKHHNPPAVQTPAPDVASSCRSGAGTNLDGTCVTQEEYARLTYYRVRADCIVQANMSYNHCPAVMPPLDQTLPRGADVKPYDFLERGILSPSAASDIRLKFDIAQVGQLDNGVKLYRFRYIGSDQAYVGVMAQQVAAIVPEAVVMEPNGYLGVYYDRLGLKLQTWQEWQARKSAIVNQ